MSTHNFGDNGHERAGHFDYEDHEDHSNFWDEFAPRVPPPLFWRTRDGTRIKISEMTLSHVLNTQNLLSRSKLRNQTQLQAAALSCAEGKITESLLQSVAYRTAERIAMIERWQHLFNLELDRRGVGGPC